MRILKHTFPILPILYAVFLLVQCSGRGPGRFAVQSNRQPQINPDYRDLVIPVNIAPLNFKIEEVGSAYTVRLKGEQTGEIIIRSKDPKIEIPIKKWKSLLSSNESLMVRVFIRNKEKGWTAFQPYTLQVSQEEIDPYLVFRLIRQNFIVLNNMGIYQRNLEDFSVSTILDNKNLRNCMNCHVFSKNDPDRWLLHMRGIDATGMLLTTDGETRKINTATPFNHGAAYASWHPNGRLIAFSVNGVKQFFHSTGYNRDVMDLTSKLILYNVETNTVTSDPNIASKAYMETYPQWAPDGKTLYFCRAPQIERGTIVKDHYKEIQYDLARVSYDPESGSFGEPETVLSAKELGGSISFPRISGDGRFLLFCKAAYGNFPVHNPASDLYLLDLQNGTYRDFGVNSSVSESSHSWSSNNRWVVFSSKRRNRFYTRPYLCHVDENGKTSKPFIVPQKDPEFYDGYLYTFNLPELIVRPVRAGLRRMESIAGDPKTLNAVLDPDVQVDESTGATENPPGKLLPYF